MTLNTDDTAGCRQPSVPAEWFFDDIHSTATLDRARNICNGVGGKPPCPFLADCAEWGIRYERWGVWGGLNADQRQAARKARNLVIPVERVFLVTHRTETGAAIHGEGSGVYAHTKLGESFCADCLVYTRERNRKYSKRNRGKAS